MIWRILSNNHTHYKITIMPLVSDLLIWHWEFFILWFDYYFILTPKQIPPKKLFHYLKSTLLSIHSEFTPSHIMNVKPQLFITPIYQDKSTIQFLSSKLFSFLSSPLFSTVNVHLLISHLEWMLDSHSKLAFSRRFINIIIRKS